MGCEKAELHRLIDLIEYELFERDPRPKTIAEIRERWERIAAIIRELSISQLRTELGL